MVVGHRAHGHFKTSAHNCSTNQVDIVEQHPQLSSIQPGPRSLEFQAGRMGRSTDRWRCRRRLTASRATASGSSSPDSGSVANNGSRGCCSADEAAVVCVRPSLPVVCRRNLAVRSTRHPCTHCLISRRRQQGGPPPSSERLGGAFRRSLSPSADFRAAPGCGPLRIVRTAAQAPH